MLKTIKCRVNSIIEILFQQHILRVNIMTYRTAITIFIFSIIFFNIHGSRLFIINSTITLPPTANSPINTSVICVLPIIYKTMLTNIADIQINILTISLL